MLSLLLLWMSVALAGPVHLLKLNGGVDPGSADYLVSGIEGARAAGASAVIIQLDTPGGLLQSAREIVSAELSSPVPVVVWVGPSGARAGSAGVFLTLAANVAVMAPGTTIGAAHPVSLFGDDQKAPQQEPEGGEDPAPAPEAAPGGTVMDEKILNDTLAWARAIAAQRGRNGAWAESAVRESAAITDQEALDQGVIDGIVADLPALLDALHGLQVETPSGPVTLETRGAAVIEVPMSARQRLAHFLGDPNVLFALIGLGLLALYVEYQSPGLVVPGALGVLLLLAAGVGLSVLPFQLGGLLLVVAGFVTIGLEAYVGGKGAFAVLGTLGVLGGGLLLFEVDGFDLRVDTTALLGVGGLVLLVAVGLGGLMAAAQRRPVLTGAEGMVGLPGVITQGGAGAGRVRVRGEDWAASWSGERATGEAIRVVRVQGSQLVVEAAAASGGA